jgi:C1A family cysteine protease
MKAAVFSCAVGVATATPSPDVLAKFSKFRAKWGHTYAGTEFIRRVEYFEQNLRQIEEIEKLETGTATYSFLGPFADFSKDEMSQRKGWLDLGAVEETEVAPSLNATLAGSFDWVAKGAVNAVQNQGQCGSCWAFSTVANFEGAGFVSGFKLVKLSEQEIVDCDTTCNGCGGGLPSLALKWTASHGGVGAETGYPYHARNGACHVIGALSQNTGFVPISKDENQIAQALVKYGPLSIGVDASLFNAYSGGVMRNSGCSGRLDHAVNIVGYGEGQVQYWKVRNSWGASWGEQGYVRMSRGDCTCGLCQTIVTATGVTVNNAPTPTPPVPPPTCQDSIPFCPKTANWECQFLAQECEKSCGCCDKNPPSYCGAAVVV